MNRKSRFWIALWLIFVVVTGFLAINYGAGGMGYGPWHAWGRTGGWGEGYRADGAPGWYGMEPGMMSGAESGSGWGMGRPYGMMGQYGGEMPGMGAGYGMAGGVYDMMPFGPSDLTSEQVQKISQLQSESDESNRHLMQQRWEMQLRLNGLYAAEKRDWNAIRIASRALSDLQRQKLEASIDAQQKIDGLLTDGQRRDMARTWRGHGWMGAQ